VSTAKVYNKGQITIPKAVREAAGIGIGDRVVVEARGDEVIVRQARGVLEFEPPERAPKDRPWSEVLQDARDDRTGQFRVPPSS